MDCRDPPPPGVHCKEYRRKSRDVDRDSVEGPSILSTKCSIVVQLRPCTFSDRCPSLKTRSRRDPLLSVSVWFLTPPNLVHFLGPSRVRLKTGGPDRPPQELPSRGLTRGLVGEGKQRPKRGGSGTGSSTIWSNGPLRKVKTSRKTDLPLTPTRRSRTVSATTVRRRRWRGTINTSRRTSTNSRTLPFSFPGVPVIEYSPD